MRLEGKTAFITGASSGIGAVMARMFASEGARVAVAARRMEALEKLVADIKADGGEAIAIQMDQGKEEDVEAAIARAVEAFGGLDILVNNAGPVDLIAGGGLSRTHDLPSDLFDGFVKVALYGPFWCCKYAIPHMQAGGGGSIINISSITAHTGVPYLAAYAASKGGLSSLTRSLAFDYGRDGIRANAITVGLIVHEGNEVGFSTPERYAVARARHLTTRLGRPEDIGYAAIWLASDEAGFVTGTHVTVDGGAMIKSRPDTEATAVNKDVVAEAK